MGLFDAPVGYVAHQGREAVKTMVHEAFGVVGWTVNASSRVALRAAAATFPGLSSSSASFSSPASRGAGGGRDGGMAADGGSLQGGAAGGLGIGIGIRRSRVGDADGQGPLFRKNHLRKVPSDSSLDTTNHSPRSHEDGAAGGGGLHRSQTVGAALEDGGGGRRPSASRASMSAALGPSSLGDRTDVVRQKSFNAIVAGVGRTPSDGQLEGDRRRSRDASARRRAKMNIAVDREVLIMADRVHSSRGQRTGIAEDIQLSIDLAIDSFFSFLAALVLALLSPVSSGVALCQRALGSLFILENEDVLRYQSWEYRGGEEEEASGGSSGGAPASRRRRGAPGAPSGGPLRTRCQILPIGIPWVSW